MKPNLLIAEGDAELRDLYQQFFSDRGFEVETASDGLDCLKRLQWAPPAAVVLDLELLWGGGHGVLAWLREEKALSWLPVVLTATADAAREAAGAVVPPVVRVLSKPFALTDLLASVHAALASTWRAERFAAHQPVDDAEYFIG